MVDPQKDLTIQIIFDLFQKYEWIWKIFFIVISGVAAILFKKIYTFQTHPHFQNVRRGNISEMLLYGIPYSIIFTIVDWLIHYYLDDFCQKYYITEQRYLDPQSRKKRCFTLVKWGYSIAYYLITSVWAYKIILNTTFMPTWLGGIGSPYNMAEQLPNIPIATLQMKIFYIAQCGKHFSRFFGHVFIKPQGNFFEYSLHHGLSLFLIMFSYLTNQWYIGIFVLLIHDYSDFALIMARAYKDYKRFSKILLDIIYVHAFISWCGCRIFLFLMVCIIPSCLQIHTMYYTFPPLEKEVLVFSYAFMAFMMCCLEILHLFWTYYIAESFVSVKISPKLARHSYD